MMEIRDLHEPFMDYLRKKGIPYIRARSDQRSTIAKGWPDFTLIYGGYCLLVEFKTDKGALSSDQKEQIAGLEKANTDVHVVRDIATAMKLVDVWFLFVDSRSARLTTTASDAAHKPPQEAGRLVLFGAMVYRDTGAQLLPVRIATADDRLRLPPLTR